MDFLNQLATTITGVNATTQSAKESVAKLDLAIKAQLAMQAVIMVGIIYLCINASTRERSK